MNDVAGPAPVTRWRSVKPRSVPGVGEKTRKLLFSVSLMPSPLLSLATLGATTARLSDVSAENGGAPAAPLVVACQFVLSLSSSRCPPGANRKNPLVNVGVVRAEPAGLKRSALGPNGAPVKAETHEPYSSG